jgi:periplasmic divalent cation tolerance protein
MLTGRDVRRETRRLAQVQENDKPVLVYSTFPSVEAAEGVGRALVGGKLAACVNILPGMVSIYCWEGRIERGAEAVMIIKTRTSLAERVVAEVRARHAYENPALLVLPVLGGSDDFLTWIMAGTQAAET